LNIKTISLAALVGALSGCAGHGKTARAEPIAPALGPILEAPLSPAAAAIPALSAAPALSGLFVEPLGCPFYAGDDRPDYDSQTLDCIVKWMGQTRDYLAHGGKPTKYTSEENFEIYRAEAKKLSARISKWVGSAQFDAVASPIGRLAPDRTPLVSSAGGDSTQRFLSGVILFQKGDYIGARREWLEAKRLDPGNSDAQLGLERLDKLMNAP